MLVWVFQERGYFSPHRAILVFLQFFSWEHGACTVLGWSLGNTGLAQCWAGPSTGSFSGTYSARTIKLKKRSQAKVAPAGRTLKSSRPERSHLRAAGWGPSEGLFPEAVCWKLLPLPLERRRRDEPGHGTWLEMTQTQRGEIRGPASPAWDTWLYVSSPAWPSHCSRRRRERKQGAHLHGAGRRDGWTPPWH